MPTLLRDQSKDPFISTDPRPFWERFSRTASLSHGLCGRAPPVPMELEAPTLHPFSFVQRQLGRGQSACVAPSGWGAYCTLSCGVAKHNANLIPSTHARAMLDVVCLWCGRGLSGRSRALRNVVKWHKRHSEFLLTANFCELEKEVIFCQNFLCYSAKCRKGDFAVFFEDLVFCDKKFTKPGKY